MRVVRAGPRDAPRVAELGRRTYRQHFAEIWTPDGLEAHLARQFDDGAIEAQLAGDAVRYYLALDDDDRPVAYAKLLLDRALPVAPGDAGAEIEKLYAEREATGRGHGAALIAHVAAEARAASQRSLWLDVLKTNADARRFYERHGFAVVGELPLSTGRYDIGLLVMRRALR